MLSLRMVLALLILPATLWAQGATSLPGSRTVSESATALDPQAITFTNIGAGLPALFFAAAAWGDYDNDGDLDLALTGFESIPNTYHAHIYRNDGAGVFTDLGAGLPGVRDGAVAWGDYDGDGDLDLALTGIDVATYYARIYRNDGGTFTDRGAGLPGVRYGSVAWGDCDNDGDLDLLLMGSTATENITYIYRNDGGSFADLGAGLPGFGAGSAAWGDYDNDGDLDLLLTGGTVSGRTTRIYRNDGAGAFADVGAGLPGLNRSTAVWGDYDSDGDLDILMTGNSDAGFLARVYRNDGGGVFTDIGAGLLQVGWSMCAWGDYDNDGDLDLVLSGDTGGGDVARVYRYDGGATFTDIGAALTGVEQGGVAWGDYDHDGDLDLLLTGNTYVGPHTGVYRSDGAPANAPPTAPGGLSAQVSWTGATLSWSASTDGQTPAAGLSYNLRIGTTPGGSEVTSAMANSVNGYRRVVQLGNAQQRTSWTVRPPHPGTFYWSVQAVDGASAGSPFAAEGNFQIVTFADIVAGLPAEYSSSAAWGDYDNDGDLDIILTGRTGGSPPAAISRVYRNDGNGTFTELDVGLPAVHGSAVAWGDYDNDGDLDLALTGNSGTDDNPIPISRVYRNDGGGVFVDINANLPGVAYGAVAWGDYDKDGDLDLALAGNMGDGANLIPVSRVYRNDGGIFIDVGAGLLDAAQGPLAWGDYDHDGDLDLLQAGNTGSEFISRVYRNDGGLFTDIGAGLPGFDGGSAAWGDYDNDGDLDLVLTGYTTPSTWISRVYHNNGSGSFTDIGAGLPGVHSGSVAWGDYDNDGYLDLLLSGSTGSQDISRVYRNDGTGAFTDITAALGGVYQSSAAWGDYDNDGDLDILLVGFPYGARVYRSDGAPANTPPSAPSGLTALVADDIAIFSWSASTDGQTPAAGLTYNLRVGTAPGGIEICSPMAHCGTGCRRVVQLGNAQHRTSWTMKLPGPGQYYWSVQAVDGAFAGSPFATEGGLVPVLASLVSIEAQADRVRVTWYAAQGLGAAATVYRRTAETDWTALGWITPDGTGYLRYEDLAVEPGARYGYRLGILEGTGEAFVGETWVEVPKTALVFALEGVRPNPTSDGELTVHFVLPTAERARLEVLDVHGRRVARYEVATSGRHVVKLGRDVRLAPGIYVVRLSQGPNVRSTRATVLR